MSIEIFLENGSPQSVEALATFLKELEFAYPAALQQASVVSDEGGIIYVHAEFNTDEENWEAGDELAKASVRIQEDTGILVVLSPATKTPGREDAAVYESGGGAT